MAPGQTSLLKLSAYRSADSTRSSILVLVLWTLCLLVVFALSLGYSVRQRLVLAYRLDDRGKLRFIAEAGVKRARIELKKEFVEGEEGYYALDAFCSNNPVVFRDISVGDGTFSVRYEHLDEIEGVLNTRYGVMDEESKVNINKADQETLRRLFRIALDYDAVQAQELAASIVDWRDSDSKLSIPSGSAEDREYQRLQYPYEAKDADFEVLEELLLVKGVNKDIFERLRAHITVYGEGKVNVNTASKTVLLALGLDGLLADKIISFRAGEDGKFYTYDDNVFAKESNIMPRLSQFTELSESQLAQLSLAAERYLGTSSENFMIKSVANLDKRQLTAEAMCVVDRGGKILYWRES